MTPNGIASNAGRSIWNAVKAVTSSLQLNGNKGTAFENRDLRAELRDAIVTMVQATDLWKSNDPADGLYGT
jgi:hypothetical protein